MSFHNHGNQKDRRCVMPSATILSSALDLMHRRDELKTVHVVYARLASSHVLLCPSPQGSLVQATLRCSTPESGISSSAIVYQSRLHIRPERSVHGTAQISSHALTFFDYAARPGTGRQNIAAPCYNLRAHLVDTDEDSSQYASRESRRDSQRASYILCAHAMVEMAFFTLFIEMPRKERIAMVAEDGRDAANYSTRTRDIYACENAASSFVLGVRWSRILRRAINLMSFHRPPQLVCSQQCEVRRVCVFVTLTLMFRRHKHGG